MTATIKICRDTSFISNDDALAAGFNYEEFAQTIISAFPEITDYEFVDCAFHFVEYLPDVEIGDRAFEIAQYIQDLDLDQFFD